jgi:hypothetical protein
MTNATLSPRLIASIVDDIDSGRPLWGMLRVNEVVPPYHPLHRTLAERATKRLTPNRKPSSNAERILNGVLLQDLSVDERLEVDRESSLTERHRGPFVRVEPHRKRHEKVRGHRRAIPLRAQNYCGF